MYLCVDARSSHAHFMRRYVVRGCMAYGPRASDTLDLAEVRRPEEAKEPPWGHRRRPSTLSESLGAEGQSGLRDRPPLDSGGRRSSRLDPDVDVPYPAIPIESFMTAGLATFMWELLFTRRWLPGICGGSQAWKRREI